MPDAVAIHQCTCSTCKAGKHLEVIRFHQQINVFLSRLNEPQRRWYVGSLSLSPDAPTDIELSRITGIDEKTIRRGRRELEEGLTQVPLGRQRLEGGGRPSVEKKRPHWKMI